MKRKPYYPTQDSQPSQKMKIGRFSISYLKKTLTQSKIQLSKVPMAWTVQIFRHETAVTKFYIFKKRKKNSETHE